MTVGELLDALDGCGIIFEDEDLVNETLLSWDEELWADGIETELEVI